jgi:NADPH:quinone reductase-like Zn-dependent oxidoreductase
MHAFQIQRHGGPEVLEWREVPTPEPAADQVRVRVRACALNRLDLWVREGVPGHEFPLPLIPGSEVAGEVDRVGSLVRGFEPGAPVLVAPGVSCGDCDRCLAGEDMLCPRFGLLGEDRDGGYAEYVVAPSRNILPLPTGLSFAEAAAVPLVFLTAWHMVHARAALRPFEDVLIHAAGSGVSSAAILIARLAGARRIIVTAGSDGKLDKARELGATHAVNYRTDDFVAAVRDITAGKGVDVVLDHVGGETFENSLRVLAWGGRLVFCGATTAPTARINLRALFFKNQSILGSTMGSLAELRRLLQFVDSGDLRPVVDRLLPLREAAAAQAALENREQFGKIVLTVDRPVE